jgi:hypothetical protein
MLLRIKRYNVIIQFFIIHVLGQLSQGQLQTQRSVDRSTTITTTTNNNPTITIKISEDKV